MQGTGQLLGGPGLGVLGKGRDWALFLALGGRRMGPGAAISQGTMGNWLLAAESHHGLCGFWLGLEPGLGLWEHVSWAPGD